MKDRALLPGEYALLSVLALEPKHGYELAAFFREHLVEVCPIEQSLLYAYIRNVEERGYVTHSESRVGARPPRKVYSLTREGRDLVEAWLRAPVGRMRQVRRELLIKLFVLHRQDPRSELNLLKEQILSCEAYLRRLEVPTDERTDFARLVARAKCSAAEGTIRWLREYLDELEAERR